MGEMPEGLCSYAHRHKNLPDAVWGQHRTACRDQRLPFLKAGGRTALF